MNYFRQHADYDLVFEVRTPSGKFLGMVEYDQDDSEIVEDLKRLLNTDNLLLTEAEDLSKNLNVNRNGKTIATVLVDAPFYRASQLQLDDCLFCGSRCEFRNFAFICGFGHGVRS